MTADPLGYPGSPVTRAGALVNGEFLVGATFDVSRRRPVLAVGSNASIPVLRSKLSGLGHPPGVVPVSLVNTENLVVGVSAHVSRAGYVPATPVGMPGGRARLVVCWFDATQLAAIDATEPNYDRVRLSTTRFGVDADVYVSKHGFLADAAGTPRASTRQHELIAVLLEESAALRRLAGATPQKFVASMQNAVARARAIAIFREEGWVSDHSVARCSSGRTSSPNKRT